MGNIYKTNVTEHESIEVVLRHSEVSKMIDKRIKDEFKKLDGLYTDEEKSILYPIWYNQILNSIKLEVTT